MSLAIHLDLELGNVGVNFDFQSRRVLVVGDIVLNQDWICKTDRTSPEAPVSIAHFQREVLTLGGAGHIAACFKALHAVCTLITVVGEDAAGRSIEAELGAQGLHEAQCRVLKAPVDTHALITVISHQQQLLAVDNRKPFVLPAPVQSALEAAFVECLADTEALVLVDTGGGTLVESIAWVRLAKARGIPVIVLNHDDSRWGCYRGLDYGVGFVERFDEWGGIALKARCDTLQCSGFLAYDQRAHIIFTTPSDRAEVVGIADLEKRRVRSDKRMMDRRGLEGNITAVLTVALLNQCRLEQAVLLADLAAQVAVTCVGHAVLSSVDLQLAYADDLYGSGSHFLNIGHEVRAARLKGETIVFANGCFDVFHAGHVAYLKQASTLGDHLFVAINDDDSIRRLKGPTRPQYALWDRWAVLSGLSCVRWVVPFFEDTPQGFLAWLKPDVLVKGGDYRPDQVVGAEIVRSYGGQVSIIDHGCTHISSTRLLLKEEVL